MALRRLSFIVQSEQHNRSVFCDNGRPGLPHPAHRKTTDEYEVTISQRWLYLFVESLLAVLQESRRGRGASSDDGNRGSCVMAELVAPPLRYSRTSYFAFEQLLVL